MTTTFNDLLTQLEWHIVRPPESGGRADMAAAVQASRARARAMKFLGEAQQQPPETQDAARLSTILSAAALEQVFNGIARRKRAGDVLKAYLRRR